MGNGVRQMLSFELLGLGPMGRVGYGVYPSGVPSCCSRGGAHHRSAVHLINSEIINYDLTGPRRDDSANNFRGILITQFLSKFCI